MQTGIVYARRCSLSAMSSVLRAALFSIVLSSTFGCTFFSLDSEDLVVPPPKPEAAAGKSAEATAGAPQTSSGGASGSETGGAPGATTAGGAGM